MPRLLTSTPANISVRVSLLLFVLAQGCCVCNGANAVSVSTYALAVTGTSPNYTTNLGNINGLGLGTPANNVSTLAYGGGELYWAQFNVTLTFQLSGSGSFALEVSTNYAHPTVETAYVCNGGACSGVTPTALTTTYTTIGNNLANGSYYIYVGSQIKPTNGASAFTGADSVALTFQASSIGLPATCKLTLNVTVQNAVQFTLATSGAGLTISPATDFSAAFGYVNGLGLGTITTGLATQAVSGGTIYETPYSLLPVFSSFTSTTGTLSVYVSSNFTHSVLLAMEDASTSTGPYTAISLTSSSPTVMTSAAVSNTTVTRYLGMFVSSQNGTNVYSGTDNVTLSYQMTVP